MSRSSVLCPSAPLPLSLSNSLTLLAWRGVVSSGRAIQIDSQGKENPDDKCDIFFVILHGVNEACADMAASADGETIVLEIAS